MREYTVAVVTATRAEYGLLKRTIKELRKIDEIETKLIVTGTHLEENFGKTILEIKEDEISIDAEIQIIEDCQEFSIMTQTMSNAMIKFGKYFSNNNIDLLVVLGDRYEILSICIAAMNERIPIAHLSGGETTEGAIDEAIRHSISKISSLHFATTEEHANRIIQMGENPDRVFNVGDTGVENILKEKLLEKEELEESLGIALERPYILTTYHPETLEEISVEEQLENLLKVCDKHPEYDYIFTKANADDGGQRINDRLEEFAESRDNVNVFASLGLKRYLSAVKYCKAVAGNSSSGIVEAPVFLKPTINIGNRQSGRQRANTIVDCENTQKNIENAFAYVSDFKMEDVDINDNPYYKENPSQSIAKIILEKLEDGIELKKKFYDL